MSYHHMPVRMAIIKKSTGTSLMVQRLRICLLMQRTRVQFLLWEHSTYHKATKPMHHNY